MEIKDLKVAKQHIKARTGLHLVYTPFFQYFVLVNTDVSFSKVSSYGEFYPGISDNKTMQHMAFSGWSNRKNNMYTVGLDDFLHFNPTKLSKEDQELLEEKKKEILDYLKTNNRHSKYFYNGPS